MDFDDLFGEESRGQQTNQQNQQTGDPVDPYLLLFGEPQQPATDPLADIFGDLFQPAPQLVPPQPQQPEEQVEFSECQVCNIPGSTLLVDEQHGEYVCNKCGCCSDQIYAEAEDRRTFYESTVDHRRTEAVDDLSGFQTTVITAPSGRGNPTAKRLQEANKRLNKDLSRLNAVLLQVRRNLKDIRSLMDEKISKATLQHAEDIAKVVLKTLQEQEKEGGIKRRPEASSMNFAAAIMFIAVSGREGNVTLKEIIESVDADLKVDSKKVTKKIKLIKDVIKMSAEKKKQKREREEGGEQRGDESPERVRTRRSASKKVKRRKSAPSSIKHNEIVINIVNGLGLPFKVSAMANRLIEGWLSDPKSGMVSKKTSTLAAVAVTIALRRIVNNADDYKEEIVTRARKILDSNDIAVMAGIHQNTITNVIGELKKNIKGDKDKQTGGAFLGEDEDGMLDILTYGLSGAALIAFAFFR